MVIETPKKPTARQQLNEKDWEEAYQRTVSPSPEVQMKEPEEKKPHKVKEFKFDPWADLKKQRPNITYKELFEITLSIKQAVRTGISQAKPAVRFVNAVQEEQAEEEEWTSSC